MIVNEEISEVEKPKKTIKSISDQEGVEAVDLSTIDESSFNFKLKLNDSDIVDGEGFGANNLKRIVVDEINCFKLVLSTPMTLEHLNKLNTNEKVVKVYAVLKLN